MADHPYRHLPEYCFWRQSVVEVLSGQVDPVVSAKFKLGRADRVATAGSCFAQHIARYLRSEGFNYFVTEQEHPLFAGRHSADYNYGVFTARFGNVYTVRQLVQLLERAYGLFSPVEDVWPGLEGHVVDPFRPQIQPNGFACVEEFRADREQHFAAVRRAVEELDVFIFTLGLTEAWESRDDGAIFPLCPGVAGGLFDPNKHVFHNFGVVEVVADMEKAIDFVRSRNPLARFILTVSPVPLVATAEDRSVLVSSVYSKSVLRVAAEELARGRSYVAYFPSYEIITGNHARGAYFSTDLRSVTEAGVAHVMRLFMRHYASDGEETAPPAGVDGVSDGQRAHLREMEKIAQAICDEEALARIK